MMTAKEARDKVNDLTNERNKKLIDICESKINETIESGHSAVSIEVSLTLPVKSYFEQLGYKVEYNSHMNEGFTTISW